MESLSSFFSMGGYAGYIWPSYLLTVVVMAVVLVASIRQARARERELEAIQRLRPNRRRDRGANSAVPPTDGSEVPQA